MSEHAYDAGTAGQPTQPRAEGEVAVAMRDLDNAADTIAHQLELLADRLGPTLRAPGPAVADIAQKLTGGETGVEVADTIWSQVHRLNIASNRLRDLIDRVAL